MLCLFLVVFLISCQKLVQSGKLQAPLLEQHLTHTEIEEMLSKYPELRDKFETMEPEYQRYMLEIISVLHQDPDMREKMDSVDNNDISAGYIADELEKLKPELRSQLNEIKRVETNRLLEEWRKRYRETGRAPDHIKHLDVHGPDTFEINDLRYLMKATIDNLNEVDKMRRQLFKEHEMKKKLEEEEKLKTMSDTQKAQYMAEKAVWAKVHREREKQVHHPGSKNQFNDVWENTDQMQGQAFNPTTFFLLHDLNGDQVWDADEVKALFYRDLQTLFKTNDADFDPAEKEERSEVMREHYFEEADTNKDKLITLLEFKEHFQNNGYLKKDWSSFQGPYFTKEEFEAFSKKQNELKKRKTT